MSFLEKLFRSKEKPVKSYDDLWEWFGKNSKDFFEVVERGKNIDKDFFRKLAPKLAGIKDGYFFLTGMYDDDTAELVITPEGIVKNIVFVEELINSAPAIEGWKFTALKPALDIKDISIELAGYKFSKENLSFYSNQLQGYPDEIDITVVYQDYDEKNRAVITNGICIFLDNFIGELNFVTTIDNLKVVGKSETQQGLIPIEKLKDFLIWRQKEFVEKYEGMMLNTENANHSIMEAQLESGNKLIAIINTDILNWENKASHPWIAEVQIKFDGRTTNGMPDANTYHLLDGIENDILEELKDFEGCLNIGRQTADGIREIYFACKDFRRPSKILYSIQMKYEKRIEMDYDIYIDKYWRSFNRFKRV